MKCWIDWVVVVVLLVVRSVPAIAQVGSDLRPDLIFHAPFDDSTDALVVPEGGDRAIYTADSLARKSLQSGLHAPGVELAAGEGRYGGALRFREKSELATLYKATAPAFQPKENGSGTFSFWLRLDPDKDLKEGYCDPLQFTQREWNDATLFVDFDRFVPRDFRLGAFADIKVWNPQETPWENIALADRPMVVAKHPPFARDKWTHVAFTYAGMNPTPSQPAPDAGQPTAVESPRGKSSICRLYLNGESQGELRTHLRFTWAADSTDPQHPPAAILLGIYYIGWMDDLAVFSRALTAEEIKILFELRDGVNGI